MKPIDDNPSFCLGGWMARNPAFHKDYFFHSPRILVLTKPALQSCLAHLQCHPRLFYNATLGFSAFHPRLFSLSP
eukprot:4447743-Amphidinium_carterae.1